MSSPAPQNSSLTPDTINVVHSGSVISDPVSNHSRVLVRQTATGFEQTIAASAGFFTAGPLGAIASWATIRGCQGKWTPWFVLGLPAVVVINVINVAVIVGFMEADPSENSSMAPISYTIASHK